jgi:hypothetical protein
VDWADEKNGEVRGRGLAGKAKERHKVCFAFFKKNNH